ncbi:hypothetical protein ACROYT_G039472 [Oculina patagonica]
MQQWLFFFTLLLHGPTLVENDIMGKLNEKTPVKKTMGSTFYLCLLLIMLGSITVQGAPAREPLGNQKENPMRVRSKQDKHELTLNARVQCGPCYYFVHGRCVYDHDACY